jgi:hypothetical protein
MKQIAHFIFLLPFCVLSGLNALYAQSDSMARKEMQSAVQVVDSEKNMILNHQSEELQAIQVGRLGDSIRLLQLQKEMLQLGAADKSKKQILSEERDQIVNRDSIRYQYLKKKVDSVRSLVTGFPVVMDQDTLFFVYAKLGSFSPKERADALSRRLLNLADDYFFNGDSLKISPSDLTTDIMYRENVIKSVSEMDAIWENNSRDKLAESYKTIIVASIKKYKAQHSWKARVKDISIAVLVVIILFAIIFFINKIFRWVRRKMEGQKGNRF